MFPFSISTSNLPTSFLNNDIEPLINESVNQKLLMPVSPANLFISSTIFSLFLYLYNLVSLQNVHLKVQPLEACIGNCKSISKALIISLYSSITLGLQLGVSNSFRFCGAVFPLYTGVLPLRPFFNTVGKLGPILSQR